MTTETKAPGAGAPGSVPKRELTMMEFMATEGGRKCPACGRYAKESELGFTGGTFNVGGSPVHISSYGHLPGFGCNQAQNDQVQARSEAELPATPG